MARIFLEIELVGVHQKYEVETDDEISGKEFKEKLIQEIENTENYSRLDCNKFKLYNSASQNQINGEYKLKENGVVSGDYFYLI